MVRQINSKAELETLLAEAGNKLVVIDFYATWCGPCKKIAPVLDTIAKLHDKDLLLVKVDVDEVEELVGEYGIEVMPTFVFKRRDTRIDTLVGSNEPRLRELIKKHLSV